MRTPHAFMISLIASSAMVLIPAAGAIATAPTAPSAPAPRLQQVAFTSPLVGYGLFSVIGTTACQAAIASTANGGIQFSPPVVAARWSCNTNAPVSAITADSSGDVFVYGPGLRASHNHGASWATVKTRGDVMAVSAVGRSVWLLAARCPGHGSPTPDQCPVRLMTSTNGGRTWRAGHLAGATVRGFGSQPVGQAELLRPTRAAAYVLTSPEVNSRGKPDAARIWVTGNGGASWSGHSVPCGLDALAATPAVGSGKIFVACADEPGVGQQAKSLASSTDGGRHWTVRRPCRSLDCQPLSYGYLGQIAATSSSTVFLVGPRSALLVTHNSGGTWASMHIGDQGGGTAYIAFFGSRGVLFGYDYTDQEVPTIWHSTNGGTHWKATHPIVG